MVIHVALIFMLLTTTGCIKKIDRAVRGIGQFDAIVNSTLAANGLMDAHRFDYQLVRENERRHYVATYRVGAGRKIDIDGAHWIAVITVANAGELIDVARYKENNTHEPAAKKHAYAKRYMDVDIINVPTNYTPQGVFSGLCMTTLDEQFDVRIMASNLLPDDVPPPNFDHAVLGKTILEAYANQTEN